MNKPETSDLLQIKPNSLKASGVSSLPLKASPAFSPVRSTRSSTSQSDSRKPQLNRRAARTIPSGRQVVVYRITASGTTFAGNTSFPTSNTFYTPAENFSLLGNLVVEPRINAQNSTRRNGPNSREVTFIIGGDRTLIAGGTLRYSTHTWGHRHWGGQTLGRPQLDTAFVRANNRTNTLSIGADAQWSRNDSSNLFSWRSSLVNAPKQILLGGATIRFTNRGRRVSGRIEFFGNGFIEPGAYAYVANFTGVRL